MSGTFDEPDHATPLDAEEREGLIPTWIANRDDLNVAEADNITSGAVWAQRQRQDILTTKFVRELHRRMFGNVWKWAGEYRRTLKNIGVDPWEIPLALAHLLDDAQYWRTHTVYPPDETAVRLHHQMVLIHPFPNGNGRHSRLMADLMITRLGEPPFSWGAANLSDQSATRDRYINALRTADNHDIGPLLAFSRS